MVIELVDYDRLAVHSNVQKTVDLILRGVPPRPEVRVRTGAGVEVVQTEETQELKEPGFNKKFPALSRQPAPPQEVAATAAPQEPAGPKPGMIKIYPYGIARTRLERAIRDKKVAAYVCTDLAQADAVMAIRSTYQNRPRKLREAAGKSVPTVVVKSNTFNQISGALDEIMRLQGETKEFETDAMEEVLTAIDTVMQTGKPFELAPQPAPIRKMQHQVTEARRVASEAVGEEPHRRLRILPTRLG